MSESSVSQPFLPLCGRLKPVATLFVAACALVSCGESANGASDDAGIAANSPVTTVASTSEQDVTDQAGATPAADGSVAYEDIGYTTGSGEFTVSVGGGEPEIHLGDCEIWADDVSVMVFFQGNEGDLHLHQLINDDPNIAWSGPAAEGSVLNAGVGYELEPTGPTFTTTNIANGGGVATNQAGETTDLAWSLSCN